MPRSRKEEPVEETPEEEPVAAPAEAPAEETPDEEVGGVSAASVSEPTEANLPVGNDTCVNHPDREATVRTSAAGANQLLFCDECARNAGEGTQPVGAGQPVSAEDAAAAQAAAGPDPTPEESAAAKAAAGEE